MHILFKSSFFFKNSFLHILFKSSFFGVLAINVIANLVIRIKFLKRKKVKDNDLLFIIFYFLV